MTWVPLYMWNSSRWFFRSEWRFTKRITCCVGIVCKSSGGFRTKTHQHICWKKICKDPFLAPFPAWAPAFFTNIQIQLACFLCVCFLKKLKLGIPGLCWYYCRDFLLLNIYFFFCTHVFVLLLKELMGLKHTQSGMLHLDLCSVWLSNVTAKCL